MRKLNLDKMEGKFFPSEGETCFLSLDGSDVAAYLEAHGEPCIGFYDTGRNGLAVTKSGFAVSTNGYVHIASKKNIELASKR